MISAIASKIRANDEPPRKYLTLDTIPSTKIKNPPPRRVYTSKRLIIIARNSFLFFFISLFKATNKKIPTRLANVFVNLYFHINPRYHSEP